MTPEWSVLEFVDDFLHMGELVYHTFYDSVEAPIEICKLVQSFTVSHWQSDSLLRIFNIRDPWVGIGSDLELSGLVIDCVELHLSSLVNFLELAEQLVELCVKVGSHLYEVIRVHTSDFSELFFVIIKVCTQGSHCLSMSSIEIKTMLGEHGEPLSQVGFKLVNIICIIQPFRFVLQRIDVFHDGVKHISGVVCELLHTVCQFIAH